MTPGVNSVRATFTAIMFLVFLSMPLLSDDSCSKSGVAVGFSLELPEGQEELRNLLTSVSRLQEKKGSCLTSLARLDASLEADIEMFRRVLRSEGYYGASVDSRVENVGNRANLLIVVRPGTRYMIDAVSVTFRTEGEERTIEGVAAPLPKGAAARSEDVLAAEYRVLTALGDKGFPFALADERQVVIDHALKTAVVHYVIDPGPEVEFGPVVYDGAERTEESYLSRLIPWPEGGAVRRSHMDEFRSRLQGTGLFTSVSVGVKQDDVSEGSVPVAVDLEETPPRRIELGAGYSTGEGFDVEASWTHKNAWGRGENLKFSTVIGETEQTVSASLRKPHFRRFGQSSILRSRFGREDTPAYKAHLLEAFAGIERRFNDRFVGSIGLSGKATQVREDGERDEFVLAGVPLGIGFDTSNSLLDPRRGVRVHFRVQPNISLINDSFVFVTNELKASGYWQLKGLDNVVFAARTRIGATFGPANERIPLPERFFAGGGGSVRGFPYQALGTLDDDGDPIGGRSVAEVAFETRVRVSETISLVPFVDGGAVYNDTLPEFGSFRWGTGLGVRYHTSIAPVRLDVAFPLGRREGENVVAIYLSIGQSF